jgi:hypothetical protein
MLLQGLQAQASQVLQVRSPQDVWRDGQAENITELDENERAAVVGFEFYEHFEGKGESRKAVGRTKKFKFIDRLSVLALLGKACHYYADRLEQTGPHGGPIQKEYHGTICRCFLSPEEAYRRMVKGPL